jgi:transposase
MDAGSIHVVPGAAAAGRPRELEEVPMSIVGGLDIHRKQITFDYVDTVTGEAGRGQVCPADREHLAKWLARFAGQDEVHLAMEGCTGWRYVAEEIAAAGFTAHLGDPAEMAGLRGPKRRAKSDRADARHARVLLEQGRLPECWIPPSLILEYRALLELYADLREERTAWVQRIHAVLFHHGAPHIGGTRLGTAAGVAALRTAERACSPAGQLQVTVALESLEQADRRLHQVRRQLVEAARHLAGARELHARLYGVGPVTALALTCWLGGKGRFSSARKAVRFAGLDVTVYSSAGKRAPGHLSRQGPEVLRWCLYEAGKAHAHTSAPGHAYYAQVKDRIDGKRAALSQARRIVREAVHILDGLGDEALAAC